MNWLILATGKPAQAYARDGIAEYQKRMQRYAPVEIRYLKKGDRAAYEQAAGKSFRIVLDERGKQVRTAALAQKVLEWEMDGIKTISVWIGAADGFKEEVREQADLVLGLSELTMMHELALLVWMEQLYRVYSYNAGSPYHREG